MTKRIFDTTMVISFSVIISLSLQTTMMNIRMNFLCDRISILDSNGVERLSLSIQKRHHDKNVPVIIMSDRNSKGGTAFCYDDLNSLVFSLSDFDNIPLNFSRINSDGSIFMELYDKKNGKKPFIGDKIQQTHISGDFIRIWLVKSNVSVAILNRSNRFSNLQIYMINIFGQNFLRALVNENYGSDTSNEK